MPPQTANTLKAKAARELVAPCRPDSWQQQESRKIRIELADPVQSRHAAEKYREQIRTVIRNRHEDIDYEHGQKSREKQAKRIHCLNPAQHESREASPWRCPASYHATQAGTSWPLILRVDYAELEWTSAGTPRSVYFDDIYHHADDPLGQSRHVFLEGNRIAARLARHEGEFVIAEAGFGGALNFLATVNVWLAAGCPCRLRYLGFERNPLRPEELQRSLARFPELAEPASWLVEQYPAPAAGCHRLHPHEKLQLDLFLGDVTEQMLLHGEGLRDKVHAWYLDGFSPSANPGMWSWELFALIAECGKPGATVSTYSAAGAVRRGLRDAGFSMKRVRGFAGKRHMLRGVLRKKTPANTGSFRATAWFRYHSSKFGLLLLESAFHGPGKPMTFYHPAGPIRRGLARAESWLHRGSFNLRPFTRRLPGWSDDSLVSFSSAKSGLGDAPRWFRYPSIAAGGKIVAVIGAGMAGSGTARQLARRGWRVSVFERAGDLDHGVNSLGQLALNCRTFGEANPLARFFLSGFLYSAREFGQLSRNRGFGWHPSGLTQLPRPREWRRKLDPAALADQYPNEVLQWLSREQLRDLTGLPIARAGWHSPIAGWLDPLELCRCWLDHPGIELHTGVVVDALRQVGSHWNLLANDRILNREPFAAVVIACGADAASFEQLRELPLHRVPGEVVSIAATRASSAIRHIVRGSRGIFPAKGGRHCISASYPKAENGAGDTVDESLALIEKMFEPNLEFANVEASTARAPRCQSADFAPVVGAAPDVAECRKLYAPLARNARARILHPPVHWPGLYVNLAHGSHGLCSAPLAAEYLASVIHGEIPPLGRDVAAALDPMRFLIRGLRRQQTDR